MFLCIVFCVALFVLLCVVVQYFLRIIIIIIIIIVTIQQCVRVFSCNVSIYNVVFVCCLLLYLFIHTTIRRAVLLGVTPRLVFLIRPRHLSPCQEGGLCFKAADILA